MSMALTAGTLQLTAACQIAGVRKAPQGTASADSVPSPQAGATPSDTQSVSYGTGSGQADIYCCAAWTLTASGTLTWDLFTGTDFPDMFGNTAAFRKLKAVYFQIVDGTGDTTGVTIGNAASNGNAMWFGAAANTWTIIDGGPPFIGGSPAGITVDATHKNLKIANNSGSASVTVIVALIGSSS